MDESKYGQNEFGNLGEAKHGGFEGLYDERELMGRGKSVVVLFLK